MYVLREPATIAEILKANHDDPMGSHFGVKCTLEAIQLKYYWDTMQKDIETYIHKCDTCQQNKIHHHKPYGELEPIPVVSRPFETLTVDFIVKLPPSKWWGKVFDSIMVIVCTLTKFTIYIPCVEKLTAVDFADLLLDQIKYFGLPKNIILDHAKIFATDKFWSTLCYYLQV